MKATKAGNLLIRTVERRHAFVGPSIAHDWTDLVSIHVRASPTWIGSDLVRSLRRPHRDHDKTSNLAGTARCLAAPVPAGSDLEAAGSCLCPAVRLLDVRCLRRRGRKADEATLHEQSTAKRRVEMLEVHLALNPASVLIRRALAAADEKPYCLRSCPAPT